MTQGQTLPRVGAIDAYRGMVMFLMMAEVLHLCAVSSALPDSVFWKLLCYHQSHVEWVGCSLHDLIMPGFCFLVGVSLPFSIASRQARGQSFRQMTWHAATRILLLILIGTVIASAHSRRLMWPFDWVLPQIALGYGGLFVLGFRPQREAWLAFGGILALTWLAFALYPLPDPDFSYSQVGVTGEWLQAHGLNGFAAHWQKNSNLGWALDKWLLNLLPRSQPFTHFENGLTTLNFVPTLATMILGLSAGRVLRSDRTPWSRTRWLAIAGAVCLASGWLLGAMGVCPVVKRIWTPSWVLFSGGWCLLQLATWYVFVDICGHKKVIYPLVVIGTNSIAAYCLANLHSALGFSALRRLTGADAFRLLGDAYEPVVYGGVLLLGYWMILYAMHRRKLFLKI